MVAIRQNNDPQAYSGLLFPHIMSGWHGLLVTPMFLIVTNDHFAVSRLGEWICIPAAARRDSVWHQRMGQVAVTRESLKDDLGAEVSYNQEEKSVSRDNVFDTMFYPISLL